MKVGAIVKVNENHRSAGETGVIVEQDDMQLWRGDYEKGRWVQVMGPNGLQQWDIRWCTHIDDLDEEDED